MLPITCNMGNKSGWCRGEEEKPGWEIEDGIKEGRTKAARSIKECFQCKLHPSSLASCVYSDVHACSPFCPYYVRRCLKQREIGIPE